MGDDDLDREAILARRKRFIAAALSGLAISQAACAQTCLSIVGPLPPDDVSDVTDASDVADASDASRDAKPMPCLSPPPPDAGNDATPMPCLSPPPRDGGF